MSAINSIEQITHRKNGFLTPLSLEECASALVQTNTPEPLYLVGFLKSFLQFEELFFSSWTNKCRTDYPHDLFLLSRISEESFGDVSETISSIALLVQKAYSIVKKTPYSKYEHELFEMAANTIESFQKTTFFIQNNSLGNSDVFLLLKEELLTSFQALSAKICEPA